MPASNSPMNFPGMRHGPLSMRPKLPVGPMFGSLPEGPPQMTSTPPQIPMPPPGSPMAPVPSAQNHSYGGGLADRAKRPVGRSMYDLNRVAQQMYRQTKDPRMLLQMDWRNRSYPEGPMMTPSVPSAPAPMQPQGHFMPGFNGSQIYIPADNPNAVDSSPMMPPPMPGGTGMPRSQEEPPPMGSDALVPQPPAPIPGGPFPFPMLPAARLPDGRLDISKPLPMPTLGGGVGLPQMTFDNKNPVPLIPTPQQVQQFGLKPDFGKPQTYNGKQYPTFSAPDPEKQTRWETREFAGPMIKNPITGKMEPGPTIQRQVNPFTGEVRDLQSPQGGAPSQAVPSTGGGYFDTLVKPPAQAAVQTGQMPNVAYANDLPVMTKDEAVKHYQRTGDDSALRRHFAENPSQKVQQLNREAAVWKQIGQNLDTQSATMEQVQAALKNREAYIAKHNVNGPMGEGAHALDWEKKNPKLAALIAQPPSNADNRKLLNYANQLNAQTMGGKAPDPMMPSLSELMAQKPPPLYPTPSEFDQQPGPYLIKQGAKLTGEALGTMGKGAGQWFYDTYLSDKANYR